jgi:putative transposase
LLCAENFDNGTVAEMVGVTRQTVGKWRGRFRTQGLMGLYDEARPGRPRSIDDERIMELLYTTLHAEPPGEQDRWSVRTAAEEMELSKSTVQRVWSAFGVQPHRQSTSSSPRTRSSSRKSSMSQGST